MNKILWGFIIGCALCITGCQRDAESIDEEKKELPTSLTLNAVEVNDSLIVNWTVDKGEFEYFKLLWKWQPETGSLQNNEILLDGNIKRHALRFLTPIPFNSFQVVGYLKSGAEISSNLKEIKHPEVLPINVTAFDILANEQDKLLYFFERTGKISTYSLDSYTTIAEKDMGENENFIGYADMATFNGTKELYVPCTDGAVYILNAGSLQLIDTIKVGVACYSVASLEGFLYVSTGIDAWGAKPTMLYKREGKKLISQAGSKPQTRIKAVPGTKVHFVEMTTTYTPNQASYQFFNAEGQYQMTWEDNIHPVNPFEAGAFLMYPSGQKFILSSSGVVFNRNMQVVKTLANLPTYYHYAFDQKNNWLFACEMADTSVTVFNDAEYNVVKKVRTAIYPRWIFAVGGKMLVLGTKAQGAPWLFQFPSKLYLEYLK